MTAGQLDRFHRQNPTLMVNILQWLNDHPTHPVRALCQPKVCLTGKRLVNVLVVDPPSGNGPSHYVGVVNLDWLLNSKSDEHRAQGYHYERCLLLQEHRPVCNEERRQTLIPTKKA